MSSLFTNHTKRFLLFSFLLLLCSVSGAQVVDKIIAKVDNQIVLKSELEQAFIQFKSQQKGMLDPSLSSDEDILCSVFETLVINKMLLAKAEIDSVTVDRDQVDNELNRRMDHMVAQAGGDPKKIEDYFGKTLDQLKIELRKMVRDQMIIQKMQETISGKVKVTPAEVQKFFKGIPKDSLPYFSTEVEVGHIVMVPEITRDQRVAAKAKAERIRERLLNGESFCDLAKQYSEDPGSAVNCGEIGWFQKGDLVTPYEATALALDSGKISSVTESEYGYHIIQLIQRKGNQFNSRHILIKPSSTNQDITDATRFLDSLRKKILADSITFERAAHAHSDDVETKSNGGIFIDRESGSSRIPLENIDPSIFFIIDTMEVGEVSKPLPYRTEDEKEAVRIIYYKSKLAPHRANLKDDYQKIYKAALAEKKNNAINEWFDKSKPEVFIDVDSEFNNCQILSTQ